MPTQIEIRQQVTDRIVAALKSGQLPPWRKPWTADPNCGFPRSFATDKPYWGINALILDISAFSSRWWATYRGWQAVGGQVRGGEKGTKIMFWKPIEKARRRLTGRGQYATAHAGGKEAPSNWRVQVHLNYASASTSPTSRLQSASPSPN